MAIHDPADKARLRMEARRFASRCDGQIAQIERADSLREISRLLSLVNLPYSLSDDYSARDALRMVQVRAEDRVRDLIKEQLQDFVRAEDYVRDKLKRNMFETWTNLTGPLAHLRTWALTRLTLAEQQIPE